MIRFFTIIAAFCFGLASSMLAQAGNIQGRLGPKALDELRSLSQTDGAFWRLGQKAGLNNPVIIVVEGEAGVKANKDGNPEKVINLEGYGFFPEILAIPVGSFVTFKNMDPRD